MTRTYISAGPSRPHHGVSCLFSSAGVFTRQTCEYGKCGSGVWLAAGRKISRPRYRNIGRSENGRVRCRTRTSGRTRSSNYPDGVFLEAGRRADLLPRFSFVVAINPLARRNNECEMPPFLPFFVPLTRLFIRSPCNIPRSLPRGQLRSYREGEV